MAEAAAEAVEEELSLDGRILVRWTFDYGLGNIQYRNPEFLEAATGAPLFDLGGRFEGSVRWLEDGRFNLLLTRWYQGGHAEFVVDPGAGTFRVVARAEEGETEDGPPQPLAALPARAELEFERDRAERERLWAIEQRKFQRWMFWNDELPRFAWMLLATLALLAAIAAGAYWWESRKPRPPLDKVPPMPKFEAPR
jgi:hypothetical protein